MAGGEGIGIDSQGIQVQLPRPAATHPLGNSGTLALPNCGRDAALSLLRHLSRILLSPAQVTQGQARNFLLPFKI